MAICWFKSNAKSVLFHINMLIKKLKGGSKFNKRIKTIVVILALLIPPYKP